MAQHIHVLYWVFACLTLLLLSFSHADMITSLDHEKPIVRGRVYCNLCSAGGVTLSSFFIQGARVVVQCRNSSGNQVLYTEAVTDSNGRFHVNLDGYHHDQQVCKIQLRNIPNAHCNITTERRISSVNDNSFEHTAALAFNPLKKQLSCSELNDLYERQPPWFLFLCIYAPLPRGYSQNSRAPPPFRFPCIYTPPPPGRSPNSGPPPPLRAPTFLICPTVQLSNPTPPSRPIPLPFSNPTPPSRPIPLPYFSMPPAPYFPMPPLPYFSMPQPPYFPMPPASLSLSTTNTIPPSTKEERSGNNLSPPPY